ncbi:acyl-coenzyme A diphosphatase FITM2-like [Penaeus japonicus]|uniref:acyl-coenzyme A diphosphatase FITM2-like n=1 Tax=Penaeus japonicus TaxID=27405 RepID=UPI001C710A99|nr:acyl-coenzyme A diphosphatase FITM2-like [Penaeus japonicus]
MPAGTPSTRKGRSGGSQRSFKAPIEKGRWAAKGTKPLPEQASVQHVLSLIVVHGCRKVLFIETEVKIALYSICLFVGSLLCDFIPMPKVYMGQKDNVFNVYFVKLLWVWLILVVGAFILLTSATIGCGHREVIKRHMSRLLVGTCLWYFWSQLFFGYVENRTGTCLGRAIIKDKYECISGGFHWHSFDISGHAFILVYVNLLIVEEAKAIVCWEGIRDQIRLEDHRRGEVTNDPQEKKTPLENLSEEDLVILKLNYEQFTPLIRCIFFIMTMMSILSDVMLACTVMFFHTMPQKVAGGAIAMATWFCTYRLWYKCNASPGLPGSGIFQYQTVKERAKDVSNRWRRRSSICKEHKESLPTFMGMPLYGLKKDIDEKKKENEKEEDRSGLEDFGDIPDRSSRNGMYGDFGSPRSRTWRR